MNTSLLPVAFPETLQSLPDADRSGASALPLSSSGPPPSFEFVVNLFLIVNLLLIVNVLLICCADVVLATDNTTSIMGFVV